MKIKLWDIFKVFTKIGLILIGGGYVIIPLLKDELIDKRNWITEKELVDYFALSHTLPGLIAGNIAIFIGYKLRGKWGGLMAMLGISTGNYAYYCTNYNFTHNEEYILGCGHRGNYNDYCSSKRNVE